MIAIRLLLIFANAFKSVKEQPTIAVTIVGRAITKWEEYRKEAINQSTKLIQIKEIKSNNFCYCKVGRAITKWGEIEKSPILLLKYWKN